MNHQRGCTRWVAILMALFGVVQVIGSINVLLTPSDVRSSLPYPVLLVGIVGLGWALAVFGLALSLFRQKRWAWVWSAWYVVGYVTTRSLSQIIWAVSDYERQRIPFLLTTSLLILVNPLIYLVWYYPRRDHANGD